MAAPENLAAIALDGQRILEFARRDPTARVPQYPAWTLTDLVAHVASVHSRTIAICTTLPSSAIPRPEQPRDRDPFEWFEETVPAMLEALRDADPEAIIWSFIPDPHVRAWERRMVIETGIHRWDAQQAVEEPDPLPPIVARQGLDEFEVQWLPRLGTLPPLELVATDLARAWRFGDGPPVTSVSGLASDLYLRLVARPGVRLPERWEAAVDALERPSH